MNKLHDFATERQPLRASRIPSLMQCAWRYQLEALALIGDSESGAAADTGSAMHKAAQAWHMCKDEVVAVGVMREKFNDYPLADLDEAAKLFRFYAKDPRNIEAQLVLNEAHLEVRIPAAEGDPTGEEILIHGTCDQVRLVNGGLVVSDIKTGAREAGWAMTITHAYQLACYQIGAAIKLGRPVQDACIIRVRDYTDKKPGPVFWQCPWSWHQAQQMVHAVAKAVATVRRGQAWPSPSEACRWCPAKSFNNCVQLGGVHVEA